MFGVSGGSGCGRPCSYQVSAVDERDDVAACGGDANLFFDAAILRDCGCDTDSDDDGQTMHLITSSFCLLCFSQFVCRYQ